MTKVDQFLDANDIHGLARNDIKHVLMKSHMSYNVMIQHMQTSIINLGRRHGVKLTATSIWIRAILMEYELLPKTEKAMERFLAGIKQSWVEDNR